MSTPGIEPVIRPPTGHLRPLGHRDKFISFKTLAEKSIRGDTMSQIDCSLMCI